MFKISCHDNKWLDKATQSVQHQGLAVIEDVLNYDFCRETKDRMYLVKNTILNEVGEDKLKQAGELGQLRLMMKVDPFFVNFLEIPHLLCVIDEILSPTAIMHLQNGFIWPSTSEQDTPNIFQNNLHRDFNRYMNGYLASINTIFAIDDFNRENGATMVVPGSHQKSETPDLQYMKDHSLEIICQKGSMIVFDSTLFHSANRNISGHDRVAINHQWTRSFFKQQIDYVRALGSKFIQRLPERSQQLLGWYTRVPTSLDEFYQSPEKRLYRPGQG